MSEELKACPFCGKQDVEIKPEPDDKKYYYIVCKHCGSLINGYRLIEDLVIHWSLRPIEDALQSEIARLTQRVRELDGLLDKANACIGSVVACCTYGSEQSAKTGAYGISLDAFTKIDTYMRTISESNWLPLLPLPAERE